MSNYVINWDGLKLNSKASSLNQVWENVKDSFSHDHPQSITLPDGRNISYNDYLFHNCFAKGRITEDQLIKESLIDKKGGES